LNAWCTKNQKFHRYGTGPARPKETRSALRRFGQIDPESIQDYIMTDGYAALGKAVTEMTSEGVIDEILKSVCAEEEGEIPHRKKMAICRESHQRRKIFHL
jgi:NADP-reducing hydrogenase subunit HndC